jgi:hypothetical protein
MHIFLWLLNGFLAVAYLLWGKLLVVLLTIPLLWLYIKMPILCGQSYNPELRPWLAVCSGVWLLSSVFSPSPVPLFLLVMALVSAVMVRLESYNPVERYWSVITGMTIYSLVGVGAAILAQYFDSVPASTQKIYLAQGQDFVATLVSFGLYMLPVAYLGMLLKGLFIHAPTHRPQEIARQVRTRGWK